jgi:predicted nucleic acid-binding protein
VPPTWSSRTAASDREAPILVPVVDASIVVDWVAPDADPGLPAGAVLAQLAADEVELLAPRLLMEEVSNALLTGIRRGRWNGQAADNAHRLLRQVPVRLADEPRDLDRAWDLARRYDAHPIYDMVYVALAERRRTQLITADAALRRLLGGVDWIVTPEALLR